MASRRLRNLILIGGTGVAAIYGFNQVYHKQVTYAAEEQIAKQRPQAPLLSREEHLKNLRETPMFDILVIGGGATGAGIALDATTRGLKTALVEMEDFASGSSSRSTKLIHGGVRYLQKALMQADVEQYRMVKEALQERANLLKIAPHLSYPLPIMLPVYKWWQVPYYWVGIKAYDIVAGRQCLKSSYFLSKKAALELFPMLKKDKLCGALVYYDGQQDDARMNLTIALTACRYGASVANHVTVTELIKSPDGKLRGAKLKDNLTGKQWTVNAKCVINATGPFTDSIRKMDDSTVSNICQPSAGVHIILPGYYSPSHMGLLDPQTSDGRVIFFLPWQNHTIAGTTDRACEISHHPAPTEQEIQFILNEVRHYLSSDIAVRRGDVTSAWSGIRPLVLNPAKANTESLARNHIIHVSDSGLVTIGGGKWTTYRSMAEETVDKAIEVGGLTPEKECQTLGLLLEGAHSWSPTMFIKLVQDFGFESEVAYHLANRYGDRAFSVARMATMTGKRWPIAGVRLHEEFPYLEAEVRYSIKEYACTAEDVLARRTRLAFLNVKAAYEALPKIVSIMAEELKWSRSEQKAQYEKALEFLNNDMGQKVQMMSREQSGLNLSRDEVNLYIRNFQAMDQGKKGYISVNDLRKILKKTGEKISGEQLHEMLNEVDLNQNGQIELAEYLELMSGVKSGAVTHSRLAKVLSSELGGSALSVERSGGGI